MKRHASKWLLAATLGVSCLVACGSGDGSHATNGGSVSEPLTVTASDATRANLGVTKWGIGEGSDGTTVFRGYDASTRAIVEVTHTLAGADRANQTLTTTVTGAHGTARMSATIALEPDAASGKTKVTHTVVENTFDADANARAVLKLLGDDVKASAPSATSDSSGGVVLHRSVHAADTTLVGGSCFSLTTTCKGKLARGAAELAGAGWFCTSLVATTATALLCIGAAVGTEGAAAVPGWECAAFMGKQIPMEALECATGAGAAADTLHEIGELCFTGCRAGTSSL